MAPHYQTTHYGSSCIDLMDRFPKMFTTSIVLQKSEVRRHSMKLPHVLYIIATVLVLG